jgi:Spy/CpxP family protein refolding chaperone
MEPLQGNKRTTLVTTITAVLVIGMASATIADAQALPMMAAQPGGGTGGMMGHSDFNIVHHIKHHLKHHTFGKGHMSPNMGSPIHAPAY